VFYFFTHEAAGALAPGIPHALQSGGWFVQNSGASRREIADAHPKSFGCLTIESKLAEF
jgi:hypothetical protein